MPLQLLVPATFAFTEITHQLSSIFSYLQNSSRGANPSWSSCDTQPRSVHDTKGCVGTSLKKRNAGKGCASVSSDSSAALLL